MREPPRDREAVARVVDGRGEVAPRAAAGRRPACASAPAVHRAGHGEGRGQDAREGISREPARLRTSRWSRARRGAARRRSASAPRRARVVDQPERVAAHARHVRVDDAEDGAGGDGRVHRRAAGLQDRDARLRRQRVRDRPPSRGTPAWPGARYSSLGRGPPPCGSWQMWPAGRSSGSRTWRRRTRYGDLVGAHDSRGQPVPLAVEPQRAPAQAPAPRSRQRSISRRREPAARGSRGRSHMRLSSATPARGGEPPRCRTTPPDRGPPRPACTPARRRTRPASRHVVVEPVGVHVLAEEGEVRGQLAHDAVVIGRARTAHLVVAGRLGRRYRFSRVRGEAALPEVLGLAQVLARPSARARRAGRSAG